MRSMLVWLMVLSGGVLAAANPATTAAQDDSGPCQPAELFTTDTDPLLEVQADVTIALNGAAVTGSTPLDGVYWSKALQRTSYERSREFQNAPEADAVAIAVPNIAYGTRESAAGDASPE